MADRTPEAPIDRPQLDRPRVVVVSVQGRHTLPDDLVRILDERADLTFVARSGPLDGDEAAEAFADADVVAVTPKVTPTFDQALLERLPRLRGLCLHATGYDFLDVELLQRHGVTLSVLPGVSTDSVAEHTLGLILALSRRIHLANDRSRGLVAPTTSLRGFELRGRTLGVIGMGRIGTRVGELGAAFGMDVLAHDPLPRRDGRAAHVPLDRLLRDSHVVSLCCPQQYGAAPMVGGRELAAMRPGSILVNPSRVSLVDHEAVASSIRSGHLRGYAVDDVAFTDPSMQTLVDEGRVLQTGHSAWWSDEVLERGSRMWGEHMVAMVDGRPRDVVVPGARRLEAAAV